MAELLVFYYMAIARTYSVIWYRGVMVSVAAYQPFQYASVGSIPIPAVFLQSYKFDL